MRIRLLVCVCVCVAHKLQAHAATSKSNPSFWVWLWQLVNYDMRVCGFFDPARGSLLHTHAPRDSILNTTHESGSKCLCVCTIKRTDGQAKRRRRRKTRVRQSKQGKRRGRDWRFCVDLNTHTLNTFSADSSKLLLAPCLHVSGRLYMIVYFSSILNTFLYVYLHVLALWL